MPGAWPLTQPEVAKRATEPIDAAIARIAASQHGLITHRQLRAVGLSTAAITKRVAAGRLHRIHRGVFAVGHAALTRESRWLAAVLATGPGPSFLSHRSVAAAWGMRETAAAEVDVIALSGAGRRRGGIRVHRTRTLVPAETTVHRGVPCTTPERTLLDLATVLRPGDFEYTLHRAQAKKGLLEVEALGSLVERHAGRPGAPALARVLQDSEFDLNGELARRFHAICRRACRRAGAPMPLIDYWIAFDLADGGHGVEVDFAWPDRRLAVETDGRAVHGTLRAFESDRARDRRLLIAGWRVMRFTWRQATEDPAQSEDELVAALLAPPLPHVVR